METDLKEWREITKILEERGYILSAISLNTETYNKGDLNFSIHIIKNETKI